MTASIYLSVSKITQSYELILMKFPGTVDSGANEEMIRF